MQYGLADVPVDQLVPHRGAMSWLDKILSADSENVSALATVRADSLFVRDGELELWIGIEYMAQTVAAWAGQRARLLGRVAPVGLLVGTRRYEVRRQALKVGDELRIEAHCELMADNGLGMFACRILVDEALAASANLSVYEPPEGVDYLASTEGKT